MIKKLEKMCSLIDYQIKNKYKTLKKLKIYILFVFQQLF